MKSIDSDYFEFKLSMDKGRIIVLLIGLLLSFIPVWLYCSAGWWMIFTYAMFGFIQFCTALFATMDYFPRKALAKSNKEYLCCSALYFLNALVALYPFILYVSGKYEANDFIIMLSLGVFAVLLIVSIRIIVYYFNYSSDLAKEEEKVRNKKFLEEQRAILKQADQEKLNQLIKKYGDLTISATLGVNGLFGQLLVFKETKKAIIYSKEYNFSDFISVEVDDKAFVHEGKVKEIASSSNGSPMARALIGGAFFGATGAIVGGATARKTTVYAKEADTVNHYYTIKIYVAGKNIEVRTQDSALARKVESTIRYIISHK